MNDKVLTIIPLATPRTISQAAIQAITEADTIFVQTTEHICSRIVTSLRPDAISLDQLFKDSFDFEELNDVIATRIFEKGSAAFAVLNRGVGDALMERIRSSAAKNGFTIHILPSSGYAEAAAAAVMNLENTLNCSDFAVMPAFDVHLNGTSRCLIIEELDSLLRAGTVKGILNEYYNDEHIVFICTLDDSGDYSVHRAELYRIDSNDFSELYDAATVLIVPKSTLIENKRHGLDGLMQVMYRLRAPGGCPWDAEQTHSSLRSSLIEEAYEVLDAIDRSDMTALEEELGDLLLQVVFHAVIEEERSEFTMRDVTTGIVEKLIYRHPHVFGNVKVNSSDDVLVNWENLKKKEKHQSTVASAMQAVPAAFPALMRSYKIQKKAAHVGFDFDNALQALPKVHEEADEVLAAINNNDKENMIEEIGDLLFASVNVARLLKIDPELALSAAADKFMNRFIAMEALILADGKKLEEMTVAQMDEYWDKIKHTSTAPRHSLN